MKRNPNIQKEVQGVKAVFLDFDGVLLDSERVYQHFWKEAARAYGFELDEETLLRFRSLDGNYGKILFKELLGRPFPYYEIREERKRRMAEYLKEHPHKLKQGALPFLAYLKQRDVQTYIVSSSLKETILSECERLHIAPYIKDILSAKDVQRGKPFPDVYLKALSLSALRSQDILVFEDSPNGIRSAFEAGLKVLMVDDLDESSEATSPLIVHEIKSLEEVVSEDYFRHFER